MNITKNPGDPEQHLLSAPSTLITQEIDTVKVESIHKALLMSEARYRRLFESAQDGIILLNAATAQIEDVNPFLMTLLGYTHEEMLGKKIWEIGAFKDTALSKEAFAQLQSMHYIRYDDLPLETNDGRRISVEFVSNLYCCEGVAVIQCNIRDNTKRHLAEVALKATARTLRILSQSNVALLSSSTEELLMAEYCRIAVETGGYHMAWIGLAEKEPEKRIRLIAHYGHEEGYLANANISWDESERGNGPTGRAVRTGQVQFVENIATDPSMAIWKSEAIKRGYRSSIAVPFTISTGATACLTIYGTTSDSWSEAERRLLQEVVADIVFGINVLRTAIIKSQYQENLKIAAAAFEAQVNIMVTDENSKILMVNTAFLADYGYTTAEVVGQTPRILKSGLHDKAFYADMWSNIAKAGFWQGEIWDRRKDGVICPKWVTITAVKTDNGKTTHYVGTQIDMTAIKAAESEIKQLAYYDPLTRLPNRRLLLDQLQQAIAVSTRTGHAGALHFLDIDHFKILNDSRGHACGDILLEQVAQRMVAGARKSDTVARLGGDEFVLIQTGLSNDLKEAAQQAMAVGTKLLAIFNTPFQIGDQEYFGSASIGIALFRDELDDTGDLLKRADLAMYQAKASGRNTVRFFDTAMQIVVNERARLEAELRHSLLCQEFVLFFQPQVDVAGRMTGAEALVRWLHPSRGLVAPADFIPLAEETGQILPMGQWILETACKQLLDWGRNENTSHLEMSVNISAVQFRHPEFVEQVLSIINKTGANPNLLKLELTESLLVDNFDDIIEKMSALKGQGICFSLDDFGTGYSSLSYLKRLPLDQLKIDQSFVRDILSDSNDATIAKTIVALGNAMGLSVIAEGVETEEQRQFLANNGCNAYQGYLFSQPLSAEALKVYMASHCK